MGLSDCQPDAGREVRTNVVCGRKEEKLESNLALSETTTMRLPSGFQMCKVKKSKYRWVISSATFLLFLALTDIRE